MQKCSLFLILVLVVTACGSTSSQENDLNSALEKIEELENQILELEEEALSTVTTSEATTTTTTTTSTTTTTLSPSSTTTTTIPVLTSRPLDWWVDVCIDEGCFVMPREGVLAVQSCFTQWADMRIESAWNPDFYISELKELSENCTVALAATDSALLSAPDFDCAWQCNPGLWLENDIQYILASISDAMLQVSNYENFQTSDCSDGVCTHGNREVFAVERTSRYLRSKAVRFGDDYDFYAPTWLVDDVYDPFFDLLMAADIDSFATFIWVVIEDYLTN